MPPTRVVALCMLNVGVIAGATIWMPNVDRRAAEHRPGRCSIARLRDSDARRHSIAIRLRPVLDTLANIGGDLEHLGRCASRLTGH